MSAKQYGIPTPIQFDRLYAGPLDKHEVFDSYSEALTYAQGSISYPGQTIGVKKSGLKEDVYVINQDKSLSRLMIQREDIRVVLKKDKWTGECPYEQTISIPYLEATDNCIISLGESVNDPEVVREIVNAKIGDTIQEEGSIRFIARGSIPTVDIPITITIASVVSAVEIPNNVNDNTNHTVVIAKKDAWQGVKPPYTQDLYVFGVRPDSNGTIGINPDSSYAQINKMAAATAGVVRYEQRNNYVTIAAMNSKPTRDLEILVVWGDEIVVFENSDTLEDFNTTVDLVLKANEWTTNIPYTQEVRVEGLSEYHTGAIGLSDNCTPEQAEIGLNASLELIEQGNGYIVVRANDIKPTVDLPIYLTYGSNITIVPAPEYVGEANRHVDTMAYASKWIKSPDGWEQEVDVQGITSNSIGTMGLRNGTSELQAYAAATARIKITKVYDNKVLLTAIKNRPNVNLPLCFVFGRNINVAKYPGVIGKVSLDTNYIIFDDSLINSGLSTLQQLLEYLQKNKINYDDVVDSVHDGDLHKDYIPESDNVWKYNMPLSARMGRYLFLRKINYDDIIDNVTSTDKLKPLSANMGKYLSENIVKTADDLDAKLTKNINDFYVENSAQHTNINQTIDDFRNENSDQHVQLNTGIADLQKYLGPNVIRVSADEPTETFTDRNIIWIKADGSATVKQYTIKFNLNGGTGNFPDISENVGTSKELPEDEPTRDGYTFIAWSDGTNNISPGGLFVSSTERTVTLSAVWEPMIYKVTLNNQEAGEPGIGEIYYRYTEDKFYSNMLATDEYVLTDISSALPEKEGYKFEGYYSQPNTGGIQYITSIGEFANSLYNTIGDSTIYARWKGNTYTITFNVNGGSGQLDPLTTIIGTDLTIPLNYKPNDRLGYTFLGWSDDKTATEAKWIPGDTYSDSIDITLYAVWSSNVYKTELIDGDVINTILYHKYNEDIIYTDEDCTEIIYDIVIPELEGYSFYGYYTGKDGNGTQYIDQDGKFINNMYLLADDITLNAYFGSKIYTVSFDVDGGTPSEINPIEGTLGYTTTIPTEPIPEKTVVQEGYDTLYFKFNGWEDEEIIQPDDGSEVKSVWQPGEEYIIKGNATLTAVWESIVEITLDNEDRKIYNLLGINEFYSDSECTTRITSITPPTNDIGTFAGYYGTLEGQTVEKQYITADGHFSEDFYKENISRKVTLTSKWVS